MLIIGCLGNTVAPIFNASTNNTASMFNETTKIAQISLEKILKLKETIEAFIRIQYKQNVTLKFNNAKDNGQFILINFSDEVGRPVLVPVSRDVQYMYGSAEKIDEFAAKIKLIEAQQNKQSNITNSISLVNLTKLDIPIVELYIFSYCPAGVQALNSFTFVGPLFNKKADIKVRFFSDMHGNYERQQNKIQACIQQINLIKYWTYATKYIEIIYPLCKNNINCDKNESIKLMDQISINSTEVMSCVDQNGEALYLADVSAANTLSAIYSPSLRINNKFFGADFARDPEGIKTLICSAFNIPPVVCNNSLSTNITNSYGSCGK